MTVKRNIEEILKMVPHRYPFVLIDRILECIPGESALAVKNVTYNEPHFMGHFPDRPIMPGVLIIEAMAQASAMVVVETLPDPMVKKEVYFMSIEEAKFRKPVTPGDVVYFKVKKEKQKANVWKFHAEAIVEDKLVAEAKLTAMILVGDK